MISPYVLAELAYLVATRHGVDAELSVLTGIAGGAWLLPSFGSGQLTKSISVIERYRDQEIGLADVSLLVLADQFGSRRILTLDHRHFDIIRPIGGGRFSLLP